MKKIIISTLCLLCSVIVSAQKIGLHSGVVINSSSMIQSSIINTPAFSLGWEAGVNYSKSFNDLLALKSEIGVIKKGSSLNLILPLLKQEYTYLQVSPMLEISPVNSLHFELGPNAAFLLKSQSKFFGTQPIDAQLISNPLELGINFGISYEVAPNTVFRLKHTQAFTRPLRSGVNMEFAEFGTFDSNPRNRSTTLSVGYNFDLQKKQTPLAMY